MWIFGLVFLIALLLSFLLTPIIRDYVQRNGWVDVPSEERKIHRLPIPRVGGVAIFLAFIFPLCLFAFSFGLRHELSDFDFKMFLRALAPSVLIFGLGLADDVFGLNARVKFIFQTLAALLFYFFVSRITTVANPFTGTLIQLGWLGLPITVLWLVGITNAFNLIDGIDGLAAGSALFTTLTVMYTALNTGNLMVVAVTCALAGAILGFLKYNFNPATIFMGDSGSLFIGFTLATLAMQGTQKSTTLVAVAIPLISFGFPILETSLSIARRFLAGKPLFGADRGHIHHQLLNKGRSQRQVVILLYGVSAAFALLGLLLNTTSKWTTGLILLTFGVSACLAIQHLEYDEFGEVGRLFQRSLQQRQVISNNLRIRTVLNRLSEAKTLVIMCGALDEGFRLAGFKWAEVKLGSMTGEALALPHPFILEFQGGEAVLIWNRDNLFSPPGQTPYLEVPFQVGNEWGLCRIALANTSYLGSFPYDLELFLRYLPQCLEHAGLCLVNPPFQAACEPVELGNLSY